jgi:hypothetical protein
MFAGKNIGTRQFAVPPKEDFENRIRKGIGGFDTWAVKTWKYDRT